MGIQDQRQALSGLLSRRRFQGIALAGVLAAGIGIAATSGAFASPSSQTFAAPAAATPVATATQAPAAAKPATATTPNPGADVPGGRGRGGFGPGGKFGDGSGRMGGGILGSVATFLGIPAADVQTAVGGGQTLAQVAQAHGKTVADLKAYLLNLEGTRIDQLINANLQQLRGQHPGGPGGPFGADVATFLGISQTDLRTARQNGQTLAQIAQAHGKSAADLKTFLTDSLKKRLDAAVTAGKLTAQQETDRLNQAGTQIDQMISNPMPQRGARPQAKPTGTPATG